MEPAKPRFSWATHRAPNVVVKIEDSQNVDWSDLPMEILYGHIGPYLLTLGARDCKTARLICQKWSDALPLPSVVISRSNLRRIKNFNFTKQVKCEKLDPRAAKTLAIAFSKTTRRISALRLGAHEICPDSLQLILDSISTVSNLDCSNSAITNRAAEIFACFLVSSHCTLQGINLQQLTIVNDDIALFSRALSAARTLRKIEISFKFSNDQGVSALAEALQTNTNVQGLSISLDAVGLDAMQTVAEMVRVNSSLTSLKMTFLPLLLEQVGLILDALSENQALRSLDLSYNDLEGSISSLSSALIRNSILTDLDLRFSSFQLEALCDGISLNKSLRTLRLACHNLPPRSMSSLACAIANHPAIEILDAKKIFQGSDIAILLSSGSLMRNLKTLNLLGSRFDLNAYKSLAASLKQEKSLRSLILIDCGLKLTLLEPVIEALSENTTLEELDLSRNRLFGPLSTIETPSNLSRLISATRIAKLNLASTGLAGAVICAISVALKQDSALKYLDLSRNRIDDDAGKALANSLASNRTLSSLSLSWNGSAGLKTATRLCNVLGESNYTLTELRLQGISFSNDSRKMLVTLQGKWPFCSVLFGDERDDDLE